MFLVGSGKVESFDIAGNDVKMVDQKLDEVKSLTKQNQLMAKLTVELVTRATSGSIVDDSHNGKAAYQTEIDLLKAAGLSEADINKFFDKLNHSASKTNSP